MKQIPQLAIGDFINHPEALNGTPTNTQAETDAEKFSRSILDQHKDYPLPEAVVAIVQNGETIPLLTRKSFSLWQGKQKSKKTTVLAIMIASVLKEVSVINGVGFIGSMSGKILFIDTEQGESYAARTMNLILKLMDVKTCDRLLYCDFREFTPAERLRIIEAGIESTPDVQLVVIDGIVDLLQDFMSAEEGHTTVTHLLRLCSKYNIHVAGVLHQNKNDKNARAHVGTISTQKCEIEVATEIDADDKSQSVVSCVNSRGLPFESFAIRWEKGSLPTIVSGWDQQAIKSTKDVAKTEKKIAERQQTAGQVFKAFAALSHNDAVDAIMKADTCGLTTAKNRLKEMQAWGLVEKFDDGNYRGLTAEGQGSTKVKNGST